MLDRTQTLIGQLEGKLPRRPMVKTLRSIARQLRAVERLIGGPGVRCLPIGALKPPIGPSIEAPPAVASPPAWMRSQPPSSIGFGGAPVVLPSQAAQPSAQGRIPAPQVGLVTRGVRVEDG